jgi:hypothetical protein
VQSRIGAKIKIDEGLRAKREADYLKLWTLTGLVPKYPRADDVTYAKLDKLSRDMRDWYFEGGGLYLSRQARKGYGNLQDALQPMIRNAADEVILTENYDALQRLCSRLRTELTSDLLSRERSALSFSDNLPWRDQRASR